MSPMTARVMEMAEMGYRDDDSMLMGGYQRTVEIKTTASAVKEREAGGSLPLSSASITMAVDDDDDATADNLPGVVLPCLDQAVQESTADWLTEYFTGAMSLFGGGRR